LTVRRQATILGGLLAVLAFAVFAHTSGPGGRSPTPPAKAAAQPVSGPGGGGGGGGGLPLGAPQSGAPGGGYTIVTGALTKKYTFKQVSCIRSPNTPNGLLAKGTTDPSSPSPITIGVTTDTSTLAPIEFQLSINRSWSDGQGVPPPRVHRAGKTVTFSGRLNPDGHGAGVTVRGTLTCGAITTLG
jgi:hypothetical protein